MKAGKRTVKMAGRIISTVMRAVRTKADTIKARLMLATFTVLSRSRRRKSFSIKSIDRTTYRYGDDHDDDCKINCNAIEVVDAAVAAAAADDDDKYPDLTHSLFDEEVGEEVIVNLLEDTNATSVIDVVKSKKEDGEMFNLEDEIDEVADLFINKFHRRMRLQKLLSFKRYQKMMATTTTTTE